MSATAMLPPITPQVLNAGLGARFLGCMLNIILQGFVVSQIWSYFQTFGGSKKHSTPKITIDPIWLQCLVGCVLLATIMQCIFLLYALYDVHVLNFANLSWVFQYHWAMLAAHVLTVVIEVCTQAYFARRCFLLIGRAKWFPMFLVPMLAFCLADGVAFTAVFLSMDAASLQTKTRTLQGIMGSWLSVSVVVDVAITGIMIYHLRKIRDESGDFKTTFNSLNKMILYSLNTCLLSTLLIIISSVLYFAIPVTESWYVLAYEPISKVYASSLMVALMSRKSLRNDMRSPASSEGLRNSPPRKPVVPVFPLASNFANDSFVNRKNSTASEKRAFPLTELGSETGHSLPFENNVSSQPSQDCEKGVAFTQEMHMSTA